MRTKDYNGVHLITDNSYNLEESDVYKHLSSNGIKTVEFVRKRKNRILFIEVKDTFAKEGQTNRDCDFDTELKKVADKFVHSLNLLSALALKVKTDDIKAVVNESNRPTLIQFVLIVHKGEQEEIENIREEMVKVLKNDVDISNIWQPTVLVFTYDKAVKKKLAV